MSFKLNPQSSFVSQLAKFFRLNGSRVISGESKLSLVTSALCRLNNLFDSVLFTNGKPNYLVMHDAPQAEEFFEDVKFLFDFVRKTTSLKLFHGGQTLRGGIDVSRFSNLKILELHKVPMHLIVGLNDLCPQLTAFFCHRSICSLKEIFGNYDTEANLRSLWTELKELNIAYNYLEGFDQSLGVMPNVEYIDASHNNLKYIDEIQVIEKLVLLNLSYNLLENVPVLSGLSCYSIRVLFLRNNILEDLEGLEMLLQLEELDVSNNCISEHHSLKALKRLPNLKSLNLEGNPVFFHKRHRMLTTRHLHSSVISRGIFLNRKILGPEEVLKTMRSVRSASFYAQSSSTHQTAINVIINSPESRAELIVEQTEPVPKTDRPSFGADEISIGRVEEFATGSAIETSDLDKPVHKLRKKRRKKKHSVPVEDPSDPEPDRLITLPTNENEVPLHLQTKQMLETRRREYKEGWLIPTPTFQEVLNSTTSTNAPPNTPATNIPIQESSSEIPAGDALHREEESLQATEDQTRFVSEMWEKLMTCDTELKDENDDVLMSHIQRGNEKDVPYGEEDVNANYACMQQEDSDNAEDSDNEGCLFLVEADVHGKTQFICAKLKENSIKEIDLISGKVFDYLDLRCLTSVNMKEYPQGEQIVCDVQLTFSTIKASRKKIIYGFESLEAAQSLCAKLKPFADAKAMEDSILGALQCLKCGSQFSKHVAGRTFIKVVKPASEMPFGLNRPVEIEREMPTCPNCSSTIVVEMEVMPLPSAQIPSEEKYSASNLKTKSIANKNASYPATSSTNLKTKVNYAEEFPSWKGDDKRFSISEKKVPLSEKPAFNANKNTTANQGIESNKLALSSPSKLRRSSNQTMESNQSSSITIISDTESNLDIIPEKITIYSPLPPSPDVGSEILGHENSSCSFATSSPTAATVKNNSDIQEISKKEFSSSVTESVGNEYSSNSLNVEKEFDQSDLINCENVNLVDLFEEKEQFSCETFTSIDHRLKLHLEVGIFDDEETLLACLQTGIVPISSKSEEFQGLLVISSKKIYIMNLLNNDCEQYDKSMKQVYVCPLKQLKLVQTLLGNQGFSIVCSSDSKTFVCLVRDADLCNCFTSHLIDITNERLALPDVPRYVLENESYLSQVKNDVFSLNPGENDVECEILLHLFGYLHIPGKTERQSVCFIVTPIHIHITKLQFQKQVKQTANSFLFRYAPLEKQQISDLIEVKLQEDLLGAEMFFKDEERNIASQWLVSTQTKSSLLSFVSAFKGPWDSVFGIDLPLSVLNT